MDDHNDSDEDTQVRSSSSSYDASVNEILPGLWLGDMSSAQNQTFLSNKQIQFIIHCFNKTKEPQGSQGPQGPQGPEIKYDVPLVDRYQTSDFPKVCQVLDGYCLLIKNHINTHNILIYCHNGLDYAPLIVTMYLMKYGVMDLTEVIRGLASKRPQTERILIHYEHLLIFYQKNFLHV